MKKFLLFLLMTTPLTICNQSYTNGNRVVITKLLYTDMDGNVKTSFEIKNSTIEVNISLKLITIKQPNNYYERYFYSEYNKNIVVKGNYMDMFTIYKSYSSESRKPLTDVLIFTKIPKTNKVTSLNFYYPDQGFVTYLIKIIF